MDASTLRELSTNALTGHWPAYLGLRTDAEKIEYLARQIELAATEIDEGDAAFDRLDALETENDGLQNTIDEQAAEIEQLKGKYRVDWFTSSGQPRSMRFEKWSDAQDEAQRRDAAVYTI